jgi:hypothetical protein
VDDSLALRLRAAELVRNRLPRNAIEAAGQNGVFWCTPLTAVLIQSVPDGLAIGTFNSRLTHAGMPFALVPPGENPERLAERILRLLMQQGTAVRLLQPVPPAVTTTCGAKGREGIDVFILATQKRLELLHYWMRENTGNLVLMQDDPETAMVQRYIQLLSMLVDSAQSGLACTVTHALDRTVPIFQRLLVEYAIRAHYALRHPDYTLWRMTVREAEEHVYWLEVEHADELDIAAAQAQFADAKRDFPTIAVRGHAEHWKDITFKDMFIEVASREQHASLYYYPSTLIHGDPASMRHIFRQNETGSIEGVTRMSDTDLNSDLVDVNAMLIEFLGAFQQAFPELANSDEATSRLAEVDRENLVHTLRYPEHRNTEYLSFARSEVGES